jgi:hypothetical protein
MSLRKREPDLLANTRSRQTVPQGLLASLPQYAIGPASIRIGENVVGIHSAAVTLAGRKRGSDEQKHRYRRQRFISVPTL